MAIFGAATAHEDDPERAVRSALGICERVAEAGDADLRVRVGVTSGEALVSHDPAGGVDAVGDVVNTAARLESAAPLGGVWWMGGRIGRPSGRSATRRPRRLRRRASRSRSRRGLRSRRGRSCLSRCGSAACRWSAATRRLTCCAMRWIGRGGSRRRSWCRSSASRGSASRGWSRNCCAYVEELPELITWRRGRSLSYGEGVAFWALGEMVKAQAGILESDDAATCAEAKLARGGGRR